MVEYFTPSWRRPVRENDVAPSLDDDPPGLDAADGVTRKSPNDPPPWRRYPCLACGEPPSASHKRCGRCRAAVYCSSSCQRKDYVGGKHRGNCVPAGKLWEEKARLEGRMWENKNGSTNPFDDEVYEYPVVGRFWRDRPATTLEKTTTRYCVVLLQLVQLLGRAESWRTATSQAATHRRGDNDHVNDGDDENESKGMRRFGRRVPGNPLSRELAIDIAYRLLHLDRTDMRVRLLIPSLLLESEYFQEAYDFLKHWLGAERSLAIMELALMGGDPDDGEGASSPELEGPAECASGSDMLEAPEAWMDGEMVYPSVGMVFELAFLKCYLLCSLRRGRRSRMDPSRDDYGATSGAESEEEETRTKPLSIAEKCAAVDEAELERQVRVLLSLVHEWNPHLLPNLGGRYDVGTGASDGSDVPAAPPAISSLLDKHPPGFELQYKMGNPGGRTPDEAVSIWQRGVALWHVVDPTAMTHLSRFCSDLEANLADTGGLKGGAAATDSSRGDGAVGNGSANAETEDIAENASKRREAEELVARLQRERPDRTMGEIMMHPEMAQLMVKHLHTE